MHSRLESTFTKLLGGIGLCCVHPEPIQCLHPRNLVSTFHKPELGAGRLPSVPSNISSLTFPEPMGSTAGRPAPIRLPPPCWGLSAGPTKCPLAWPELSCSLMCPAQDSLSIPSLSLVSDQSPVTPGCPEGPDNPSYHSSSTSGETS